MTDWADEIARQFSPSSEPYGGIITDAIAIELRKAKADGVRSALSELEAGLSFRELERALNYGISNNDFAIIGEGADKIEKGTDQ